MSAEQKYEHVADTFQSELDDSRSNAGHKYDLFTAVRWLKMFLHLTQVLLVRAILLRRRRDATARTFSI